MVLFGSPDGHTYAVVLECARRRRGPRRACRGCTCKFLAKTGHQDPMPAEPALHLASRVLHGHGPQRKGRTLSDPTWTMYGMLPAAASTRC